MGFRQLGGKVSFVNSGKPDSLISCQSCIFAPQKIQPYVPDSNG